MERQRAPSRNAFFSGQLFLAATDVVVLDLEVRDRVVEDDLVDAQTAYLLSAGLVIIPEKRREIGRVVPDPAGLRLLEAVTRMSAAGEQRAGEQHLHMRLRPWRTRVRAVVLDRDRRAGKVEDEGVRNLRAPCRVGEMAGDRGHRAQIAIDGLAVALIGGRDRGKASRSNGSAMAPLVGVPKRKVTGSLCKPRLEAIDIKVRVRAKLLVPSDPGEGAQDATLLITIALPRAFAFKIDDDLVDDAREAAGTVSNKRTRVRDGRYWWRD